MQMRMRMQRTAGFDLGCGFTRLNVEIRVGQFTVTINNKENTWSILQKKCKNPKSQELQFLKRGKNVWIYNVIIKWCTVVLQRCMLPAHSFLMAQLKWKLWCKKFTFPQRAQSNIVSAGSFSRVACTAHTEPVNSRARLIHHRPPQQYKAAIPSPCGSTMRHESHNVIRYDMN